MPQPRPWQQSGFNDAQLLQQHVMFKQLQELQRQHQLQQLGDVRQQNSINQLSAITKQATGGSLPPLINGTPIHDASQMFMNLVQRGASAAMQGVPNGPVFSQEQGQALCSMGRVPQQLDVSLYGTPVASARSNLNQYSHLQGMSNDNSNLLTKSGGNQVQKPIMQSSAFGNSFLGDQCTISPDKGAMPTAAFIAKQEFQGKNFFGQVPIQGLNNGNLLENFQLVNAFQKNASMQEIDERQEQAGWSELSQEKTTQIRPSQSSVALDPLEEKILFNTDDNVWDVPFGMRIDPGTGSFGNALEHAGCSNAFPSVQSGSWSALMQSAVAEASSSDTGLQEEWSGLTFQNTELSTDNHPSNFMDSGKQQAGCIDNNLLSASSLSSKPFAMFNDSNMSSNFPGFPQSGIQVSLEQRDGLHRESSLESNQQSPKNSGKWLDRDSQKMSPFERNQLIQPLAHLENAWAGQTYEHSENDAHQQSMSNLNNGSPRCNKPKGDVNAATYEERVPEGFLWKTDFQHGSSSFSKSAGGLEQIQSAANDTLVNREFSQLNKFAGRPSRQGSSQQDPDSHQLRNMSYDSISMKHRGHESMGIDQHELSNGPQVLNNSYSGVGEAYEKRQNCHGRENSNDSYNSVSSQHPITGREVRDNLWLNASGSQLVAKGYQKSSGQVPQGLSSCELGYFGQSKSSGSVPNSAMDFEKGHIPEFQGNSKASEGVTSRGNVGTKIPVPLDKSFGFNGPNFTAQTSQNMLKLLQKVDHSREESSVTLFGSTECNPLSEVSRAETSNAYLTQLNNQSSTSQGFGLRLAPPLQRHTNSNLLFTSQRSPQPVNDLNSSHVDPEFGEKGQGWLASSSSVEPSPSLQESSRREHWDEKSGVSGQMGVGTSHLNMQGISSEVFKSGHQYLQNQFHRNQLSNAPAAYQISQATLPSQASRLPPFNLAASQDASGPSCINPFGRQFPVLEALSATQPSVLSGMPQQGGFSSRPESGWSNLPTQRVSSGAEPHNVLSSGHNSLESTSWAPQELNEQNSQNIGNVSLDFGVCSTNQRGVEHGEEKPGKEQSQQQISSGIPDPASHTGGLSQGQESVAKHFSDAGASASGPLMARLDQQDINRVQHRDNQVPVASAKNLEAFGHSLKPSNVLHQNYSLLHQVQAMKNVGTDPSRRISRQGIAMAGQESFYGHKTGVSNPMDNELNAPSRLNSSPFRDAKTLGFLSEAKEDKTVKALSQPFLQDNPSRDLVSFGHGDSQSHSSSSSVAFNSTEPSQISLQMANSWFKQYGNFKNGQMLAMYDARTAKTASEQFSFRKPSENLLMHASMERLNAADTGQNSSIFPSVALVANENLSIPSALPSDESDQSLAVTISKKRKTATSELLSWHEEVTQGSQRLQNIRMAELDWAQATNRLTEKLEDEAEMVEDGHPRLRPKKRLILTTQLMQQLLRPAPASILSTDAMSGYDSVGFFVAKLALRDACSMTSRHRSGYHASLDNPNMMSQKLEAPEILGDQYFSKVMEDFTNRKEKLENDFSRLDKRTSILDMRVECQDLEKFSVINRFAKFHIKVQADAAETSSSSSAGTMTLKALPQRYVAVSPMPRKLPEGIQCVSL